MGGSFEGGSRGTHDHCVLADSYLHENPIAGLIRPDQQQGGSPLLTLGYSGTKV